MTASPQRQAMRERRAQQELGRTEVSRRLSRWINRGFLGILGCFLLGDFSRPVWDQSAPLAVRWAGDLKSAWQEGISRPSESAWEGLLTVNRHLREVLAEWETLPEEDAWMAPWLRPWTQLALTRWTGQGNEQVYPGRDGHLFYRHDVDALLHRPISDAEWSQRKETILDFRDALAARGIELVLLPVPVKPTVDAKGLGRRDQIVRPPGETDFLRMLREAGVHVYDPLPQLLDERKQHGTSLFLRTDTHWTPEGMESVAAGLADWLTGRALLHQGTAHWTRRRTPQIARGDTLALLGLPESEERTRFEEVDLWKVEPNETHGSPVQPLSEILLLGDSFTNMYAMEAMGWGGQGGLAEHLAWHLRRPVDRLARNADGASSTRQSLSRELARGLDRLEGVRVVVWQFASREWIWGNWAPFPMKLGERDLLTGLVLEAGDRMRLQGTLREASPVPVPGTVPYPDHIRSLHLTDLTDGEGRSLETPEVVVYIQSMADRQLLPAGRLRRGDRIILEVQPWADLEAEWGGVSRSELDDSDLQLMEPLWGNLEL